MSYMNITGRGTLLPPPQVKLQPLNTEEEAGKHMHSTNVLKYRLVIPISAKGKKIALETCRVRQEPQCKVRMMKDTILEKWTDQSSIGRF